MTRVSYENLDAFGLIPDMLNPASTELMWKQIDAAYGHGGGWHDFNGFAVTKDGDGKYHMQYPGDPAYDEIGRIRFDQQMLVMFDYGWVLWVLLDADSNMIEHKVARVD